MKVSYILLSLSLLMHLLEFSSTAWNYLSIIQRPLIPNESSRTLSAGLELYVIWDEEESILVF